MTPPEESAPDDLSIRSLAARLGVAMVIMAVVAYVAGSTIRHPITAMSGWFVDQFGLMGIFVGVLGLDSLPFTVSEPVMFMGVSGGLGFWPVAVVGGVASVLSGLLGYAYGSVVGRVPLIQRLLRRYRITEFLTRYGAIAIAVAATTPFPFAVATWGAGAARMPIRHLMLGATLRFPKVILYLALLAFGWTASA